jgi:DNA polymerase-3 subunit alpha
VVSDAEHRFTRNGDAFGTITIEDYNDSFKIFLWRENYLKFKHFLNPGTFISILGRIEIPPRRAALEFTINSIDLLQNLKEKKANSLSLKISTKSLEQVMIADLNKLFNENIGSCPVHFTIFDPLDDVEIRMPSKTLKVDLNTNLFKELKKFDLEVEIK